MQRKIIQLSPSTVVVSLPSQWVRKNKLKKGMDVSLVESENEINISAHPKKVSGSISVDISGLGGRLLWAYFDALYIAGYDEFVLITKSLEQSNYVQKMVKYFPGLMITELRPHSVRVKDIANDSKGDVNKTINRIFSLNITMIEDAEAAMKNRDWETLSRIKKIDYHINSYISYSLKQLNKFGYDLFSKNGLIQTYIKILEMFSDTLSALFTEVGTKKIKINPKIISQISGIYHIFQRVHVRFSIEKVVAIEKLRNSLPKTKDEMINHFVDEISSNVFALEELEIQLNI